MHGFWSYLYPEDLNTPRNHKNTCLGSSKSSIVYLVSKSFSLVYYSLGSDQLPYYPSRGLPLEKRYTVHTGAHKKICPVNSDQTNKV